MAAETGSLASWTPLLDAAGRLTGAELVYVAAVEDTPTPLTILALSGEFPSEAALDLIHRRLIAPAFRDDPSLFVVNGEALQGTSLGTVGMEVHVAVPVPLEEGPPVVLCAAGPGRELTEQARHTTLGAVADLVAERLVERRRIAELTARSVIVGAELRHRQVFVDAAQHELKTPIAVIDGWLEVLGEGRPTHQEWERGLGAIRRASAQLQSTVRALFEEARSLVAAQPPEWEPLAVSDLVHQVVDDLQVVSPGHQLRCDSRDADHDTKVAIDPEGLRTVVGHLVENALKYSPPGTAVTVRIERTDAGRASISVIDEGVGLPPDVDIFEPYLRGSSATAGSGLGLHVVRRIVHSTGGDVIASNNAERGATFQVLLPAAR
jgi:signal transduction histidine kinase